MTTDITMRNPEQIADVPESWSPLPNKHSRMQPTSQQDHKAAVAQQHFIHTHCTYLHLCFCCQRRPFNFTGAGTL